MNSQVFLTLIGLIVMISNFATVNAKQECEVCESVINKLRENLKSDATPAEIETEFKRFCKKAEGKDEKFCYYIGGLSTSATFIVPEMTKPMSWGMPAYKICVEKLLKKDSQVCDLRYEKPIDLDAVDIKKLKVRDLKKILRGWNVDSSQFVEKREYIDKINELRPKFAPKKEL